MRRFGVHAACMLFMCLPGFPPHKQIKSNAYMCERECKWFCLCACPAMTCRPAQEALPPTPTSLLPLMDNQYR